MDAFKISFGTLLLSALLIFTSCASAEAKAPKETDSENKAADTENKSFYAPIETENEALPTADPISLFVVEGMEPTPEDFVMNIEGEGEVTLAFAEEYNFTYPQDIEVTVILTDEAGNENEIDAFARCVVVDDTAPTITVGGDIYVTVGNAVSYKSDVTVTDNTGDEIKLNIDNSDVDTDTVGEYKVIYSASDRFGNTREVIRRVFVVAELPPSRDEVLSLAKEIADKIIKDGMTDFEKARAIYDWCYKKITFDLAGTDRTLGPDKLAYDGFTTLKGDCYTYMITAKYLFEVVGIDCIEVERLRYEGESHHWWLLVDVGDGYYHFDATTRLTGKGTDTFMLTDDEVAEFCTKFEVPHYFRFDHDAYPERATVSYFVNAIPD